MTDLIQEVRAALQAATPGPWTYDRPRNWISGMEECGLEEETVEEYYEIVGKGKVAIVQDLDRKVDANLIANSPTWIQQLTDRLETAERQREEAVKALEAILESTDTGLIYGSIHDITRTTLKRIKGENGHE